MTDWDAVWNRLPLKGIIQEYKCGSDYGDKLKLLRLRKWFNTEQSNWRILEAGCGTARVSLRLVEQYGQFIGVDYSFSALNLCNSLCNSTGIGERAQFVQADILKFPFKDNFFDLVWNAGVLEHYDQQARVAILTEMKRVCKPAGFVIVFVPNIFCFRWSMKYQSYRILKTIGLGKGWPYGREEMQTHWGMKRLFNTVGFKDVEVGGICFSLLPILNPDRTPSKSKITQKYWLPVPKWVVRVHQRLEEKCPILPKYLGKNIAIKGRKYRNG